MLHLALVCLIVALIAALMGFTTMFGAAVASAQVVFYVFLVLFVSLVMGHGGKHTCK